MPEPSDPPPSPAASAAPTAMDWAAGAALGLLLGLLVGLSAEPVVSAVVTGLIALLAAMFGLSDKLPVGLSRAGACRLTAFALAAALALLTGLQLRTRWLAPDVTELRRQLAEIEITDPAEQRQMLRFLRYGLLPAGTQAAGKDGEAAKLAVAAALPLLYAEPAAFCGPLRRLVGENAAASDLLLHLKSGSDAAQRAGRAIQALPESERAGALRAAPLYLCAP